MTTAPDWLPPLPHHWAVSQLGFRYEVQLGKMLNPDAVSGEDPAPYLRNTDVQWGRINTEDLPRMSFDTRERTKFALRPGDLLVCEGGDVGRAAIWNGELAECFYQKALHRVRPWLNTEIPKFLYYVVAAASWRGAFLAEGNRSTIVHLPAEKLRAMRFPFPPRAEQHAIADFLDRKMAPIDALIAKKQHQRELIEEERRALITEWITLGPPQGRALAAASPSHWSQSRLKHLVSFTTSGSRGWAEHYAEFGAVFFRIGNLRRGRITLDMSEVQHVVPPQGAEGQRTRVRNGDVLLSITAFIGSIAVVTGLDEEAYVSQHVALVRPIPERADPVWLGYALLSEVGQSQLQQAMYGGTKVQLGLEDVRELRLPVPPLSEQIAIGTFLREQDEALDGLEDRTSRQIDKLTEYRQALVAAAVTGQLDVAAQEAA